MNSTNKIITREDSKFIDHWNRFLKENSNVSPFYSLIWMDYQRYYSEDRFVSDLSFIIIGQDQTPLCICPLYVENYQGVLRFAYRGEFLESLRTPLVNNKIQRKVAKTVEEEAFAYIDQKAIEHQIAKINFLIDPLCAVYEEEYFNHLTRYGYIDASISSQLINLTKSREDLWMELRKSYKSLINKGEKTYEVVIMDSKNPDFEFHEIYRKLHFKAAGRVTRPIETFNLQFEMLKRDESMLLGIKYKDQFVSCSYFMHNNRSAYYSSEADNPECEIPVTFGPLSQWSAIEYYKNRGLEYMELDNQQFGPQIFDHPNHKDLSISMFKRGFGGKTIPLFRGIKYYNPQLMEKELIENISQLIKELKHDS
jgi:hypothetical protein